MPTYLNLLQVVENLDDVLTDHERVISILGIQVDPVSTVRISFIFLLDLHLIRDIFLMHHIDVRHVRRGSPFLEDTVRLLLILLRFRS